MSKNKIKIENPDKLSDVEKRLLLARKIRTNLCDVLYQDLIIGIHNDFVKNGSKVTNYDCTPKLKYRKSNLYGKRK